MPWATDQNPMGGLGWGRMGRGMRAEAAGDQVVPRRGKQDGACHEGCEREKPGEGLRPRPQPSGRRAVTNGSETCTLVTWQPGLGFSCFL